MPNILAGVLVSLAFVAAADPALARDKAADLTKDSKAALVALYAKVPGAKAISAKALAILVFPKVKKGGFGIGGQSGDGALLKGDKATAFYNTSGGSFGLQAGVQTYGYAMFFMNAKALASLDESKGFEVGVGPSVVVMDEGKAKNATTKTLNDDVYAFVFGQKGLMAGLGIQGNKISKIEP